MPWAAWDISLGVVNEPNQTGRYVGTGFAAPFHINSLGWNQPREYSPLRTPGKARIAIVEALHVAYRDTFYSRAEQAMTQAGVACEWLSFGVSGAGTAAEYLTIRNHVLDIHPYIVILVFVANDLYDTSPYLDGLNPWDPAFIVDKNGDLQLMPMTAFHPSVFRCAAGRSALVRYLYYQKRLFRPRNQTVRRATKETTLKELSPNSALRFGSLIPEDLSLVNRENCRGNSLSSF